MNFIPRPDKPFRGRPLTVAASILILAVGLLGIPVSADPASTLQTLMIVDQGDFLTFQWSFYYVDFPPRFILREKPSKTISLDNPSTLYENISDIISVAFDLRIDGQRIQPDKIARLTISPNKVCAVTLIYRGRPGGHVELRAPVLQYLPPIAMINYEILPLGHPNKVVTGNLMGHEGPFPQVVVYQEVGKSDQSAPVMESAWFALFKAQLRTAWINSNWLLISVVLLVVYEPRRALAPLSVMVTGWVAICLLVAVGHLKLRWAVSELILSLPTILVAVIAATRPQKWLWIVLITFGAGLLNACYDLQQIRWDAEDKTSSALIGLCSGFACGFLSLILILTILLHECKKYREFQTVWAPRICWLMAALAILLPMQKLFFR